MVKGMVKYYLISNVRCQICNVALQWFLVLHLVHWSIVRYITILQQWW